MPPISFFVNRKLKATHETSEGNISIFFSFGDIRKQKQNKKTKHHSRRKRYRSHHSDYTGYYSCTSQFVWKRCSHQSNYTSRVYFPNCGIVAFPTSTIELMPTFEGNLFCCVKNKKAISLSKFT